MVILLSVLVCRLNFSTEEFVGRVRAVNVMSVNLTWRQLTVRQCTLSHLNDVKRVNDFVPYFRCDVHIAAIAIIELIRLQRDHVSWKTGETFVGVIEHELVAYMSHQRFK
ncbi:hypothetical protein P692DRAFT_20739856 [Suillus brevipes Sb2]|nr:hypothetical protein P692DRAFT_20739856 [Suillus brevipes Sb2]